MPQNEITMGDDDYIELFEEEIVGYMIETKKSNPKWSCQLQSSVVWSIHNHLGFSADMKFGCWYGKWKT